MGLDSIISNAAAAAASPADGPPDARAARQAELSRPDNEAGIYSKDETKRAAAMAELRAVIASQDTDADKAARKDLNIEQRREEFNVKPPSLPKPWLESYQADYEVHEFGFYDLARSSGLTGPQVRGLRDDAVTLGIEVGDTGKPASDEALNRIMDKHGVPASARAGLIRYWRTVVEGGGAS